MSMRVSALALVAALSMAAPATAQQGTPLPLGDVARQAEAAKRTVKKAKKSYTNSDLNPDPHRPSPTPPPLGIPSGSTTSAPANPVSSEGATNKTEQNVDDAGPAQQPESYWRARAGALRVQFTRLQATQAQLMKPNDERSNNPQAQASNDAELAKLQQSLDALNKQWARLESAASEAKAPTAWLDPRPQQ